jgi:hypothetical protein
MPPPSRPKWRWTVGGFALVLVLVLAVGAALADQLVGPTHSARERGYALVCQQMAVFSPFPGSQAGQTLGADEPFRDPRMVTAYGYPGQCTDLQAFYAAQATQQGWRMPNPMQVIHDPAAPSNTGHDQLDSVYDKDVGAYSVETEVDFFRDQSYSPGNTLGMTARYNLLA